MRVFLPQLVYEQEDISTVSAELQSNAYLRSRLFTYAVGMAPLLSALILIQTGLASPVTLSFLIVLGCVGLVFSFQASQQTDAVLAAFKQ